MRLILSIVLLSLSAFAQATLNVDQFAYDGNGNMTAKCSSPQNGPTSTWTVAATTLTSIAVSTNVGTVTFSAAPGLYVGARITVSGSTTAALNGTYLVSAVAGSTATITTAGVGDATYNTSALVISTSYPLTNQGVWSIQKFVYNTSNQFTGKYWAQPGSNTSSPWQVYQGLKCTDAALY